jgi:1-acyl-sn-glycerol-3-phosphate acyltransferase
MFAARLCMKPFGVRVQVQNKERFPTQGPGIIVCNHQSQLDTNICSVGLSDVNFKCIYKNELKFYPGIGTAFVLAGHIAVKRGDRDSGRQMMEQCEEYLRRGVFILFFAEGTRLAANDGSAVGDFKPGAFKLAVDTGAPIIPVSISGARDLFPAKGFPRMGYGDPVLTIHEPILPFADGKAASAQAGGMSDEAVKARVAELRDTTRAIILADMRPCDAMPVRPPKTGAAAATEGAVPAVAGAVAASVVAAVDGFGTNKKLR